MCSRYLLLLSLAVSSLASCPPGQDCIKKCCPPKTQLTVNGCVPGDTIFDLYNDTLVLHQRLNCSMYYLDPAKGESHTIHPNGTLTIHYPEFPLVTTEFCQDATEDNETLVFVCTTEEDSSDLDLHLIFYAIGLFISSPFLLATAVVYASITSLRNLHGYCLIFHNVSLFFLYVFLGLVQTKVIQQGTICQTFGYAIQFFFMATFFWLNVMCFDIYWAFSGLRNLTGSVKERERKKLIVYSAYAWCTPLLILVITVAVDLSPSVPVNSFFKPRVGEDKCFFKEKGATWIYFYLPMALIILSNIILFGVTAYRIWSHRRETAVLKRGDSRKHDSTNDKESLVITECHEEQLYLPWYSGPKTSTEKYLFTLYLKLFIVMGINWVMELLSSILGGPSYLWYFPDFTNTLQGLFIFLIFVWKKRVRRLVWAKIRSCCGKETISSGPRTTWSGASSRNTNSTNSTHTVNNSIKMNPGIQASQTTLA